MRIVIIVILIGIIVIYIYIGIICNHNDDNNDITMIIRIITVMISVQYIDHHCSTKPEKNIGQYSIVIWGLLKLDACFRIPRGNYSVITRSYTLMTISDMFNLTK